MSSTNTQPSHWGARLKELQEIMAPKSQSQFAGLLGVKPQSLSNWINGNPNYPPHLLLMKLQDTFPEVNVDWLSNGQGLMFLQSGVSSSDEVRIVIECASLLDRFEIEQDDLEQRMRAVLLRHRRVFSESAERYVRIPLTVEYYAVISLFASTLSCHLVYRRPDDEQTQEWEQLLTMHLNLLNSPARSVDMKLLNKERYARHMTDLKSLIDRTCRYIVVYKLSESAQSMCKEMKEDWDKADGSVEFTGLTIPLVEHALLILHVLILKTIPLETALQPALDT